jgi:prepilin-type N-terminal cleavage/methylation domain-containing protein
MEVNLGMLKRIKGFTLIELLIVIAIILILIAIALPNFLEAQIRARVTKANGEMRSLSTAVFDYNTALISASKEGIFPPGGGVAQSGWKPWTDSTGTGDSINGTGDNFHACSVIWVTGSFFDKKDLATSTAAVPSGTNHFDLRVMTSPIEAMTSVPLDPFKNDGGFNAQYGYFGVNLRDTFVFRSLGPDGISQVGCDTNGFRCKSCKRGTSTGMICVDQSEAWKTTPPSDFCITAQAKGCKSLADALRIGICVYSPTNGTKSSGDLWRSQE